MSIFEQDSYDLETLYNILENEIIPTYYANKKKWRKITQTAMDDVEVAFNSDRMADEYYSLIYKNQLVEA